MNGGVGAPVRAEAFVRSQAVFWDLFTEELDQPLPVRMRFTPIVQGFYSFVHPVTDLLIRHFIAAPRRDVNLYLRQC